MTKFNENGKKKTREQLLTDILFKIKKGTGGFTPEELTLISELVKQGTEEENKRLRGETKPAEHSQKLPPQLSSKIDEVVDRKLQQLKEREEFSKLSLKEKGDYLNKKLDDIEKERESSYLFKEAQREINERKQQQEFERFYEEHAKRYGRTL